jgi:thiamine pyrophosphate-dependent acetolactate synthase large subunit-like protein
VQGGVVTPAFCAGARVASDSVISSTPAVANPLRPGITIQVLLPMAAKYQIPLLIVMYNNRAYYNDWNHQIVMARTRGTDPSCAHIGIDLFGPAPDFAGLARSMGWWAEGPIENADDLQLSLQRAVAQVKMASLRWSTR